MSLHYNKGKKLHGSSHKMAVHVEKQTSKGISYGQELVHICGLADNNTSLHYGIFFTNAQANGFQAITILHYSIKNSTLYLTLTKMHTCS